LVFLGRLGYVGYGPWEIKLRRLRSLVD